MDHGEDDPDCFAGDQTSSASLTRPAAGSSVVESGSISSIKALQLSDQCSTTAQNSKQIASESTPIARHARQIPGNEAKVGCNENVDTDDENVPQARQTLSTKETANEASHETHSASSHVNQEEICQIEDVYYTTIQKMSALISQPYDGEDVKLNSDDIRERISNWTKGLKMSELQMFRLSYRLGSEITDAIKNLCDILRYELNKRTDFRGDLHQIGSYVDGIKVARVFDFDFLYIIEDKDVEVRADEEQGLYRVFRGGVEVKPRQLNSTLADCMDKIMSDISLPWPLEHGGYAGPEYSGIRFNGPAVSLQLFDKRGGENVRLIPLDITPVFPLPETIRESECVRGKIKNISQHNRMPLLLTGDVQKLYVVSHPLKNVWQPTTAYMESLIIRDLHPFSCVKVALQLTKAMLYFQQKERQPQDLRGTNSDDSTSVTVALERYAQITDGRERDIYRYQLNTKMRYQHMYLPLEARTRFREVSKSAISVNTAAIKHVILSHGAEIEGSYSTCWGDDEIDNEDKFNSTTLELIRAAYRELSNTESFNVSHAFLPLKISKFSLLPHALKEAARLTQTVQEECAAILDTFLKDDQIVRGRSPMIFEI